MQPSGRIKTLSTPTRPFQKEGPSLFVSPKRILILGTNYYPEPIGIPRYTTEMAEDMAQSGFNVTVVAAAPLYPTWTRAPGYRYRWYSREIRGGVTIWRVPTYVPGNTGFVQRTIYELAFWLFSLPLVIALLLGGQDALVITTPPLAICADLLLPMGRIRKAVIVKDLQIDIAENMGIIRSRALLRLLYRMERFILNRAHVITGVSRGMLQKIAAKKLNRPRLAFFPDWVDTDRLIQTDDAVTQRMRRSLGLPDGKIVVGYSGNLARKQGIELLVEMAERLARRTDIQFLICGDGPAKPGLAEMVESKGLTNVTLTPLQSEPDLPALLSAIDVHVVTQKDEFSDLVMPGKMFNIMSCGGAQVVTAPDASAIDGVMAEAQAGIRVRRDDKDALEAAILTLGDSVELRRAMGRKGRAYVLATMTKRSILDKFFAELFPGAAS
jgi:colanic acid biosynthesis glycosyl transferase WcaI